MSNVAFNLVFFGLVALGAVIGGMLGYHSGELSCEPFEDRIGENQCVNYFGEINTPTEHPEESMLFGISMGGVLGAIVGAFVVVRFDL